MFVAMGYLITGFAASQDGVMAIAQFLYFPMMFLSGVLFPVDFMPEGITLHVTRITVSNTPPGQVLRILRFTLYIPISLFAKFRHVVLNTGHNIIEFFS